MVFGTKKEVGPYNSEFKSPMSMSKSLCLVSVVDHSRVEGCARAKWGLREAKSCGWAK